MKKSFICLLFTLLSCRESYRPDIAKTAKTSDQLITQISSYHRQKILKRLAGPLKIKKLKAPIEEQIHSKLETLSFYLKTAQFKKRDLQIIRLILDQNLLEKFLNQASSNLHLRASAIKKFQESGGKNSLSQQKQESIERIKKAIKLEIKLHSFSKRFRSVVAKVPLSKEKKEIMIANQMKQMQSSLYFSHQKTSKKQMQKFEYFLTYPAFIKYYHFWEDLKQQLYLQTRKIIQTNKKKTRGISK